MDFKVQLAKDVGSTIADALAKCSNAVMEPKYDGWRCIVIRHANGVDVYNRSQKCYTGQLPELEADLMKLPVGTILDGELVCMAYNVESGMWDNDFFRIHTVMRSKVTVPAQRAGIRLVAFDAIEHRGERHIANDTLAERRETVQELISEYGLSMVELTIQMAATQANHDELVGMGFEGTVIKDETKPYAFGKRGHGWFKIKATVTIDCVVMGLPLDGKGQYVGQVGRMALGQVQGAELVERCKTNAPNNGQRREMTDHPDRYLGRVAEIKVYGWHEDGTPRHPTFLRWREDKPAIECTWSEV